MNIASIKAATGKTFIKNNAIKDKLIRLSHCGFNTTVVSQIIPPLLNNNFNLGRGEGGRNNIINSIQYTKY